jgi:hypothetical protein
MSECMKFLITAREASGKSRYAIAKETKQTDSQLKRLEETGKYLTPEFLCAFRAATELSWEELGSLIEQEYGLGESPARTTKKLRGK